MILPTTEQHPPDDSPDRLDLRMDEPENVGLLRMARLAERLFDVPVAYMALLGAHFKIVTRIGSGSEHWEFLASYPLAELLAVPHWWPDLSKFPAAGFIDAEIKFAASAPLRSSDGQEFGLLVIADLRPRLDFLQKDHEILAELANLLAGKMELRMMACQARAMELSRQEAESRFRCIANSAPVLIVCSGVDGARSFVNKTWLEFTGRTLEEELGDGYADTFHPDFREAVIETYWSAFQARQPHILEFPMRRHDGEYRWMSVRGAPRFLANGDFAGYIGCFVDTTDQRAAILELQRLHEYFPYYNLSRGQNNEQSTPIGRDT
jgi:PAS domain S-box-containing protein